jgi:hypothetical protein
MLTSCHLMILRAGRGEASVDPGAARPRGAPGANIRCQSPAECARDAPPCPRPRSRAFAVGHPGDLPPPGEGVFLG